MSDGLILNSIFQEDSGAEQCRCGYRNSRRIRFQLQRSTIYPKRGCHRWYSLCSSVLGDRRSDANDPSWEQADSGWYNLLRHLYPGKSLFVPYAYLQRIELVFIQNVLFLENTNDWLYGKKTSVCLSVSVALTFSRYVRIGFWHVFTKLLKE